MIGQEKMYSSLIIIVQTTVINVFFFNKVIYNMVFGKHNNNDALYR